MEKMTAQYCVMPFKIQESNKLNARIDSELISKPSQSILVCFTSCMS